MLRLEAKVDGKDIPEINVKVIRPLDDSRDLYLVHFTSVSPGMQT
jgi:hypothetical protein